MADNYFAHQELIKKTKLLLTKQMPKALRLFDRTIGLFYRKRVNGGVIDYLPIKIGKNGQCDLWGVVTCFVPGFKAPIPVHIELEFKTGNSQLNEDQIIWRDFCLTMGWIHIIVREETNVQDEIMKAINGRGLYVAA